MMGRMTDTTQYKKRLEDELALVEKELGTVGRRNAANPGDWEARPEAMDVIPSDQNELADAMESLDENAGILGALEVRYGNVKRALDKIEKGTYGICEVCGKEIEKDRLDANPAARTCIAHLGEEESLPA